MIIVYCWCGNLELGWLGSLGYILFQSNWSLKQTSEISQECVIDARMLKCTFPSLPPPQDGSTTVGGREGDRGVREHSVIERLRGVFFFFCLIQTSYWASLFFLFSLCYRLISSHPSSFGSAKIVPALLLLPPPSFPKSSFWVVKLSGIAPVLMTVATEGSKTKSCLCSEKPCLPPCLCARRHTCKSSDFSLCLLLHKRRGIWSSRKKHSRYVLIK